MADVVVFVDDYVQGTLPDVCVMTGESTTSTLVNHTPIDRPSPGWYVLILLGPIGWLILLAVVIGSHRSTLTGSIPMTQTAYQRIAPPRWWPYVAAGAGVGGIGSLATGYFAPAEMLGAALTGSLVCLTAWLAIRALRDRRAPSVALDASRRWVTLRGVHPAFAAAVDPTRTHQHR